MIRYPFVLDDVKARVKAVNPKWLAKAAERTENFIAKQKYEERSSIWSSVKPVYMLLQKNKCIFCEQQFESEEYGKILFDLEHFRPKSSVKVWPGENHPRVRYEFGTGGESPNGYYWLPYELKNYAASCKSCNSNLKSNYFPIAGDRCIAPGDLQNESPFLCYPLDEVDDDPEELVTFIGITAIPASEIPEKRRRGQVIIDFFDLNGRERLYRQRANMIILLGYALATIDAGFDGPEDHLLVERISSDQYPHAACLRAFKRTWQIDQPLARELWRACKAYYASQEGKPLPEE
jgi:hypothetical protein